MNRETTAALLGKTFLFILILIYAGVIIFMKPPFTVLDNVNLLFHEAGHLIFYPFGKFISVAGGTIMQTAIPAGITIYFLTKKDYFAAGVSIFWLGESIVNVSYYASDAQMKVLPLIGGEHDWNYLLKSLNLLKHTRYIGDVIFYTGEVIIILSIIFMFFYLLVFYYQKMSVN